MSGWRLTCSFGGGFCRQDGLVRRVGPVGQAHPCLRGGLLDLDGDAPVGRRIRDRAVPDDLVEEPGRDDEGEHSGGCGERLLQLGRFKQAERHVDRRTRGTVLVVVDLSGVQRHAQADLFLVRVGAVVQADGFRQGVRQRFDEQALVRVRGMQAEHAVPAVFLVAVFPGDARGGERVPQGPVEAGTHRDLVRVRAPRISEAFHVDDQNGPVYCRLRVSHPTSSHGSGQTAKRRTSLLG